MRLYLIGCLSWLATVGLFVGTAASTFSASTPVVVFPADSGPIEFAAGEISSAFEKRGVKASRGSLDQLTNAGTADAVILTLASSATAVAAVESGTLSASGELRPEGFSIRVVRSLPASAEASRQIWVLGDDATGVMYGGLEVAEIIRTRGFDAVTEVDRNAHFAERGVKFNIPLDVRTPSYTDAGDPGQENIETVWDLSFWREYIDRLARDRYNLVSLWNLHPFPSLVRVPEYPDIALDDVQRSTAKWDEYYSTWAVGLDAPKLLENSETLKHLTIDEKIAFWREVMRYGRSRGVKFYIVTWNVFVNGTEGKHGITDAMDNATTIDYFRRSVRELVLTYPDLAGIGLTTGENMLDATAAEKEDWAFRTYGQGVLDALAIEPGRKITFLHRQHEAGAAEIASKFAPLIAHPGVDFVYSFKYAEAHALSSTRQNFHENFLKDVGDHPVLWTLRNDDAYILRWGAPEFVREFIKNMPGKPTRGFYYGSDQWVWGREFLDRQTESPAPRQLEMAKHWYHWMLWARLGYEPELSNDRLMALLADRFPAANAARLFEAWQDASMIYPLVTGFHWGRFDFQWYIEGSNSRPEPARTPSGFHDINRFISLAPHPATDYISIPDYVKSVMNGTRSAGTTPLQVAEQLHAHADRALRNVLAGVRDEQAGGGRPDRGNNAMAVGTAAAVSRLTPIEDPRSRRELHRTTEDIRAMAHLGKYYGHKIRAATELALFRATNDPAHQTSIADELNAAAFEWRSYASIALTYYKNPIWLNRVGHVNWRELYTSVLYDLTTTDSTVAIPSMLATPGGTILEAEDARADRAPVRNTSPGFTGAGYRDMAGSQGRRWIEWTFNAPAAGRYMLEFRYAMRRQEIEPAALTINGERAGELVIWPTGGTSTWAWDRKIVTLPAGSNTIRLNPPLGPNVDHLNVIPLD